VNIYNFSEPNLFKQTFTPLIQFSEATHYCVLDNFFVFASSTEMLQNIIANYQNNTTLQDRPYFKAINENLSNEASLMLVLNPLKLNSKIELLLKEKLSLNLDNYKASAIQFIYDTNFAHVNAVIKKSKIKAIE